MGIERSEVRDRTIREVTENRILRNQLKDRLRLTDAERKTLAVIGKKLGKKALEEVASIVVVRLGQRRGQRAGIAALNNALGKLIEALSDRAALRLSTER